MDYLVKYEIFLKYLFDHYDKRHHSIEVCVHNFKKSYKLAKCPSVQQTYKWIRDGKIFLTKENLCYKKRKSKKNDMMNHTIWNIKNKTVLPISLRPKHIENRNEIGHLEIDSILGKRNEQSSIISIVDRCTRKLWLIKSEYKEDELNLLKNECDFTPRILDININNYEGTITIICDKTNKIEWFDNKLNLIDTKFNFSEKFITKFSVKNLDLPYITFKLTGDYGEKVSKRFNLIAYK